MSRRRQRACVTEIISPVCSLCLNVQFNRMWSEAVREQRQAASARTSDASAAWRHAGAAAVPHRPGQRLSVPPPSAPMDGALAASLSRLSSLAGGLGDSPGAEQLEQLRSACAAAVVAAGQAPSPAQQKELWTAAAGLWVSCPV